MNPTSNSDSLTTAEAYQWSVIQLRIATLVLTLAMAMVALRIQAPRHALWVLLVFPLFCCADFRLSDLADRSHPATKHSPATSDSINDDMAADDPAAWSSYRIEFYALLALATVMVAFRT